MLIDIFIFLNRFPRATPPKMGEFKLRTGTYFFSLKWKGMKAARAKITVTKQNGQHLMHAEAKLRQGKIYTSADEKQKILKIESPMPFGSVALTLDGFEPIDEHNFKS